MVQPLTEQLLFFEYDPTRPRTDENVAHGFVTAELQLLFEYDCNPGSGSPTSEEKPE